MESFSILNNIRQNYSSIIKINPNATFQKNKKAEVKMIRRDGKTELFETPTFSAPINLQTNASTILQPSAIVQTSNFVIPIQERIQTPSIPVASTNFKRYTIAELTAKGVLKPKLQEILKSRGLKVSGNKDQLIERILENQT